MEPPVPIPNTEVKRCSPDDSASIGCAKVGRRQSPAPLRLTPERGGLFFGGVGTPFGMRVSKGSGARFNGAGEGSDGVSAE